MSTANARRERLAARLRTVRAASFSSGQQFAHHLGWQQSRVSKLETGAQFPTEADIRAWAEGVKASAEQLSELLELLAAARIEYSTARDTAAGHAGLAGHQARLAGLERNATRVAEWQPAMIPGIVQTPAYTRELLRHEDRPSMVQLTDSEIERLINERARRQEILYETGRLIQVVIGEGALRSAPGTVETHIGQLDRLITLTGLTTVQVGVVPFPAMPVMPLCSFILYDDLVLIETLTGEQRITDSAEVQVYKHALDRLLTAAAKGIDAATLIREVMTTLQPEHAS